VVWELSTSWAVAADIAAWLVIHLGVSFALTLVRDGRFDPESWLFRTRRCEEEGKLYERVFAIRRWKSLLPDGAAIFRKGFPKKRLQSRDRSYFQSFRIETCRAELIHWIVMAFAPLFALWNPPALAAFMVAYALLANLPCILAQRYNRCRFERILRQDQRGSTSAW
jgi:glycosyl-4,4'-diaponeurosporenoate acyltransferase